MVYKRFRDIKVTSLGIYVCVSQKCDISQYAGPPNSIDGIINVTLCWRRLWLEREPDILRLLQKLVTCNGTPIQNMQQRVLVSEEGCLKSCSMKFGRQSN